MESGWEVWVSDKKRNGQKVRGPKRRKRRKNRAEFNDFDLSNYHDQYIWLHHSVLQNDFALHVYQSTPCCRSHSLSSSLFLLASMRHDGSIEQQIYLLQSTLLNLLFQIFATMLSWIVCSMPASSIRNSDMPPNHICSKSVIQLNFMFLFHVCLFVRGAFFNMMMSLVRFFSFLVCLKVRFDCLV